MNMTNMIVNRIPTLISYILTTSTCILGVLCLAAPNDTISFLIPCIFQATSNDDNEITAMEQILTRLLGGIIIAYAMNSITLLKFRKNSNSYRHGYDSNYDYGYGYGYGYDSNRNRNRSRSRNRNSSQSRSSDADLDLDLFTSSNNTSIRSAANRNDNDLLTRHRASLASSIYLGMSILLVMVLQMSCYEFPSNDNDDHDNNDHDNNACDNSSGNEAFMNLLAIAAFFVISGLLGIIASYYPHQHSHVSLDEEEEEEESYDNNNNNNNFNASNSYGYFTHTNSNICFWKGCYSYCCCCRKRKYNRRTSRNQLLPSHTIEGNVTYGNDDYEINFNTDSNTTPLLLDNHLKHDDEEGRNNDHVSENQTDEEWHDQPNIPQETLDDQQQHQSNAHVEGRITGSRRLLKLAGPHSFYLFVGCLVLLVRLPFSLSIPHFVSVTLGAVARSEYDLARMNILFLFLFGTLDAALDFFCIFLFGLANLKISRGVRIELFKKILRQEIGFFDRNKSGDLASRLNSDCGEMAGDLTWFFRFSIESVVRIFGIVLYMFLRAPKLAVCAVSVVPSKSFSWSCFS